MLIADLDLDLEVFSGPFDLLLTLVLKEEVDLMEVELADVVVSYLDFLESRGELDLEAATEFLVLIAALLELKSRLMLPGEEAEELDELAPAEAAEELVERLRERSPDAVAAAKRLFDTTWSSSPRRTFARERAEQLALLLGANHRTARDATMRRETPVFSDRRR